LHLEVLPVQRSVFAAQPAQTLSTHVRPSPPQSSLVAHATQLFSTQIPVAQSVPSTHSTQVFSAGVAPSAHTPVLHPLSSAARHSTHSPSTQTPGHALSSAQPLSLRSSEPSESTSRSGAISRSATGEAGGGLSIQAPPRLVSKEASNKTRLVFRMNISPTSFQKANGTMGDLSI